MWRRWVGNLACTAAALPAYRRLLRARKAARAVQEALLFDLLRRNADSEFGRAHQFARIRTLEQYRQAVPIRRYDDFAPWIDQLRQGRQGVLTTEPVLRFERTGGSGRATKYLPWTATVHNEFRAAYSAWQADLFLRHPGLHGCSQFWLNRGAGAEPEVTPGGLSARAADEAEFLGGTAAWADWIMAVPRSAAPGRDAAAARSATLEDLVRARDLGLISVRNPGSLTALVNELPAWTSPRELWPQLRVIRCWTGGASARLLPELRRRFPGVEIQARGLTASEGVVSIPFQGNMVPAVTSHVIEFVDAQGRACLADELQCGTRYEVVLTTGGGLYRYALGDQVKAVGAGGIEFLGRQADVSDLCGEKLDEVLLAPLLEAAAARFGLHGSVFLAPEWGTPPHYLLFAESGEVEQAAAEVERELQAAVGYRRARQDGALGPVEGVRIPAAARRLASGRGAAGDRAAYLRCEFDWRARLTPPAPAPTRRGAG